MELCVGGRAFWTGSFNEAITPKPMWPNTPSLILLVWLSHVHSLGLMQHQHSKARTNKPNKKKPKKKILLHHLRGCGFGTPKPPVSVSLVSSSRV